VSVYKVAFCPRISRITLIFFREISVIRGLDKSFFYLTLWTDTNYVSRSKSTATSKKKLNIIFDTINNNL